MQLLAKLQYWLWPNPGSSSYSNPKIMTMLVVSALLMFAALGTSIWRKHVHNPITRNLSSSWASTSFSFGLIGLILAVSRVETIQFLAMRGLWLIWAALLCVYLLFQILRFRRRHYTILEKKHVEDARDKYLPRRKRR